MAAEFAAVNWLAVIVGAAAAFGLSFLWFGPLFGKAWAAGSHGITPPDRLPVAALIFYAAATLALSIVVGQLATTDALMTAIAAILAAAAFQFSGGLFSQKTARAALTDGGAVIAMGAVMIAVQGLL